jgi:AraC-like DNA-binding protein
MSLSVVIARGILSEVQRQGHDPYALLAQAQIERKRLLDFNETLSMAEFEPLLMGAIAVTEDLSLGLSVGVHAPITMWQIVGHAMLAQRTLRHAFKVLQRYSALLIDDTLWSVHESDDRAYLLFKPRLPANAAGRAVVELMMVMIARMAARFAPKDGLPLAVHFQHEPPLYSEHYQQVFDCPVQFGRDVNALSFSLESLDAPQPHADDVLRAASENVADRLLQQREKEHATSHTVMALLRNERSWDNIDVAEIARHTRLDVGALRRRLRREGTTLTDLIDEARCRLAREFLRTTDKSMRALAEELGFSETSAFHRAFRRWTGTTPGEYRRASRYARGRESAVSTLQL